MYALFPQTPLSDTSSDMIRFVSDLAKIDKSAAEKILVDSFVTEYQKYLAPQDISSELTSWADVERYYKNYFKEELDDLSTGKVDYWVEAYLDEKLAGWATFSRENDTVAYMNLLIVAPEQQGKSIGKALTFSLLQHPETKKIDTIHLLLRRLNKRARKFYEAAGFKEDPDYKKPGNFVDADKLVGFTWKAPAPVPAPPPSP